MRCTDRHLLGRGHHSLVAVHAAEGVGLLPVGVPCSVQIPEPQEQTGHMWTHIAGLDNLRSRHAKHQHLRVSFLEQLCNLGSRSAIQTHVCTWGLDGGILLLLVPLFGSIPHLAHTAITHPVSLWCSSRAWAVNSRAAAEPTSLIACYHLARPGGLHPF